MKQKEAIKASSSAIAAVVDSDQTTSSHHLLLKSKNKKRLKVIRSFQNPIYHPPLSFSTASNGFELAVPAVAFPILSKVGVEDDGIIVCFFPSNSTTSDLKMHIKCLMKFLKKPVFRYFHFSRRRVPGVRKSQARICLLSDGELLKR
ncbi:unnamed protein product [Lactuca saligna]|uniref:Uncharacterized protein n=1 Tax=Lactuca saligna TaxID=75948 RepID=A0AA35YE69_LACSI|nr:unnamed protein product [Lactuca saligna]